MHKSYIQSWLLQHHQQLFVEQLLDAHTLVDVLCVQGNQFKEDMRMLLQIASSLEKSMYRLIDGMKSDEVACMKIVFDRMKKKMEQIV